METDAPTSEAMTVTQVAHSLDMTVGNVLAAITNRKLPAVKVDRKYQIKQADVEAWRAAVEQETDNDG